MRFPRLIALAGLFLSPAPALADEPPSALDGLARCKAIATDSDRLACFDRESAGLQAAVETGSVKIVNKAEAKSLKRSLFGFTLPKIGLFDSDQGDDEAKVLDTTISSVHALPNGRYRLVLEGGAIWQTTENPPRMREPEPGDKIQLERAALGSYWLRISGRMGVKGMRIN